MSSEEVSIEGAHTINQSDSSTQHSVSSGTLNYKQDHDLDVPFLSWGIVLFLAVIAAILVIKKKKLQSAKASKSQSKIEVLSSCRVSAKTDLHLVSYQGEKCWLVESSHQANLVPFQKSKLVQNVDIKETAQSDVLGKVKED